VTATKHIDLGRGYTATVSRLRRKDGVRSRERVLVFRPKAVAYGWTSVVFAEGDLVDGQVVIDRGMLGAQLKAAIEAALTERGNER